MPSRFPSGLLSSDHRDSQMDRPGFHSLGLRAALCTANPLPPKQIITILKQVEGGLPVPEPIRQRGICEGTFYRWKSKYVGLELSEAKRLKQVEDENRG